MITGVNSQREETSEISSDSKDWASARAASTNVGRTNNSFTCVVADSGITAYNVKQCPAISFIGTQTAWNLKDSLRGTWWIWSHFTRTLPNIQSAVISNSGYHQRTRTQFGYRTFSMSDLTIQISLWQEMHTIKTNQAFWQSLIKFYEAFDNSPA